MNIKNFPERLYQRIRKRAGRNRRSIAQEVVLLLEEAVSKAPPVSLFELNGLGKDIWDKELGGRGAADYVAGERDSWT